MFLQFLVNGVISGLVYALNALGFALIYNTTRIFHIAYAVLFALCPFLTWSFSRQMKFSFFVSLILALAATAIVSLLVELVIYRPLSKKGSSLNVIMISSIGVLIIGTNIVSLLFGNDTKYLNPGISKAFAVGSISITRIQSFQALVSMSLIIGFFIFLRYTKLGIQTRALRDDSSLCVAFGMNVNRIRTLLFILSGLFGGIAGTLVSYDVGMDPYVGMPVFLVAVVALIIGGLGRFESPFLGGLIVGVIQSLAVWALSARWHDAISFILLIIFLLVRPTGLLGERKRVV
jgi:branched-chain amino acid transport system permease protein